MKFLKENKKGSLGGSMKVGLAVAGGFIGLLVAFEVAAAIYPDAVAAGNTLNSSGISLGTLFAEGGVIWVIAAVALLGGGFLLANKIMKG